MVQGRKIAAQIGTYLVRGRSARNIRRQSGMTLLELIIACSVLLVLSTAALPVARYSVWRQKEKDLQQDLQDMRDAIDRYKDAADLQQIKVQPGSPKLSTGPGNTCKRRAPGNEWRQSNSFPEENSDRPDDRAAGLGLASGRRRSRFHQLGRQKRF